MHAAVFGSPLVKRRGADAQLPTNVGHRKARFDPFDRIHDLAIGELGLAHIEPLPLEKILLLSPLVLGDDYR